MATWDKTKPSGSDSISQGDDIIRNDKEYLEDTLSRDHHFPGTYGTDAGEHKKVTLREQSADPSSSSDKGILYTKDVDGVTELFYIDSSGNVKQLTSGGKLNVESDEAVLLSGDQTIGGVKTFSSIPVLPASDPTSDNQATRKAYVDNAISNGNVDKLDGYDYNATQLKPFGNWESKDADTVYQATTDGFVCAYTDYADAAGVTGYTDSSNPPSTIRARNKEDGEDWCYASITFPVKKGDYWKVTGTSIAAIYWIPLGV